MGYKFDLATLRVLTEDVSLPDEPDGPVPGLIRPFPGFIPGRGRITLSSERLELLRKLDVLLQGRLAFDPLLAVLRSEEVVQGRASAETFQKIARLAFRADRSWPAIGRLFEDARTKIKERRLHESRSRGGRHKDPIRQAIVERIVRLLRESDELRGNKEIWQAFRAGQLRLPAGLSVQSTADLDKIGGEAPRGARVSVTGPDGRSKAMNFATFRRYVSEARKIADQVAQ
jgi:hypothetical protein